MRSMQLRGVGQRKPIPNSLITTDSLVLGTKRLVPKISSFVAADPAVVRSGMLRLRGFEGPLQN
jgi:hypothetical protein